MDTRRTSPDTKSCSLVPLNQPACGATDGANAPIEPIEPIGPTIQFSQRRVMRAPGMRRTHRWTRRARRLRPPRLPARARCAHRPRPFKPLEPPELTKRTEPAEPAPAVELPISCVLAPLAGSQAASPTGHTSEFTRIIERTTAPSVSARSICMTRGESSITALKPCPRGGTGHRAPSRCVSCDAVKRTPHALASWSDAPPRVTQRQMPHAARAPPAASPDSSAGRVAPARRAPQRCLRPGTCRRVCARAPEAASPPRPGLSTRSGCGGGGARAFPFDSCEGRSRLGPSLAQRHGLAGFVPPRALDA
eukprot:scaffold99640_cov78-Phaeocystis_antarctica.AAC.4